MKNISISISAIFLFGITFLTACKKETIMTYSATDNIMLNHVPTDYATGQLDVSFGFTPIAVKDSIYKIPVKITGRASDRDRYYNVRVDTGATAIAGVDYVLQEQFVFRANRYIDSLPIKVIRTAAQKTKAVFLRLTLEPSADLKTDIKVLTSGFSAVSVRLNISDMLVKDFYWNSNYGEFFGTFSEKKVYLLNEVTGMPLKAITPAGRAGDGYFNVRLVTWAIAMANYLNEQKAAGNTIYEVDGTPMTMGPNFQ